MQTLFIPITEEFERIAKQCGTNPYEILETFVANITGIAKDSDQESKLMAQEYLCRTHVHSTEKYQALQEQFTAN